MSEKPFDFFANWDEAECRRFLEALKRKKTEFCEEYGLPVPAFDKEEDFYVTKEMFAWTQGSEIHPMSKCEGCQKYADCSTGSGLTWPCGAYVPVAADQESGLEHFRELTKMVPFERLKELAEADARGMVLVSKIPIGTMVYQLNQGSTDEVRIIDGEEYTRKVPNWYITHHEYSWVDAIVDAEHPERENKPNCRYYFTLEDARAERDRINAGGDPLSRKEMHNEH